MRTSNLGGRQPSVYILSGIYDDLYLSYRKDAPPLCTSAGKRKLLYHAIAKATADLPVILSPQPHGQGLPCPLPGRELEFAGLPQKFSRACGVRKIRILRDIIYYAKHVYENSSNHAIFVVDNYELIYAVALRYCQLRSRSFNVILEYEDGKHLIDRGLMKIFSGLAEFLIKPMVRGAILATPALAKRLPATIPSTLVPGILNEDLPEKPRLRAGEQVCLLYSGSLDAERGMPLLLKYLQSDLIHRDVIVEVTGQGNHTADFQSIAALKPHQVRFHGKVSEPYLEDIRRRCHFGLNLQSSDDPISRVTYPSKTFDYLNAGLGLISTKAAGAANVLGHAAIYLEEETAQGLARAVDQALSGSIRPTDLEALMADYSFAGTVRRLENLFSSVLSTTSPIP